MATLHRDYSEFLSLLNGVSVRYLLVGAHALALYGHSRYTADIDLFVARDADNIARVVACLEAFGFPPGTFSPDNFAGSDVIQVGYAPVRIDLLTALSGVQFDACWERRREFVLDGLDVSAIAPEDLIANKRATGRPQDLADVSALEDLESP
ncbi:MAG: hypothetical protein GC168_10545 [Candidatus Hydrogenedens sp.]|nr:hypothetical protein [Candidatus Hydrogenedens sp.]